MCTRVGIFSGVKSVDGVAAILLILTYVHSPKKSLSEAQFSSGSSTEGE